MSVYPIPKPTNAAPIGLLADCDLFLLLVVMLADVRLFQGSSVSSFTLYEIYIWGYCTPVVIGHLLADRHVLSRHLAPLVPSLVAYIAWLALASMFALLARQHADVLQETKNIAPALPLVCFLAIRLRRIENVERLANLYVLACLFACVVALLQLKLGGPYLRPAIENNDYKLDYNGELVSTLALGFSGTPNELAVTVLPGVILCVVKLVLEIRSRLVPRMITCVCFVGCLLALFIAESRGALIWCAIGATFVIAPTRRSQSFSLKFGLVALGIVTLVVYGLNQTELNNLLVENTVLGRLQLWTTALDALASDPYIAIFGDGMPYVKLWSWRNAGWEFPDAHNGWLDQALFFGVPALLLYLAIWHRFFLVSDCAASNQKLTPGTQVLLNGCRGTVLAFMGLFFFEPVADSVLAVGQLFFFMACGMAVATLPVARTNE